jgi:glycosyltransferase involved in cell wall biosynthesis
MGREFSQSNAVHLWCPDILASKGGIQVFSQFFLRALMDIEPTVDVGVIVKNDMPGSRNNGGYGTKNVRMTGSWPAPTRTPAFAGAVISQGLRHRPSLVITTHLHFAPAADWLNRVAGVPYWVVAHGVESWDIESTSLKKALLHAERILAVSQYTRDRLINEQGLSSDEVHVLPNTFDGSRFQIGSKPDYLLTRYHLQRSQPVILTVSRLVRSEQYKGYDRILQALPTVRKSIPDLKYIIAGEGDDRGRIEAMIDNHGLQDCVVLSGYVPDEELADHYNLCDVFAMPSKREGFGIVYLEALACGKPVIAGNKDGSVDALCGGDLGILVNPDDIGEIARGVTDILQRTCRHPKIYDPIALRQSVISEYGFERFKQLLGRHLGQFFESETLRHAKRTRRSQGASQNATGDIESDARKTT